MADEPNFRWLGPDKDVAYLVFASAVNACYDLRAKSTGLPLWKLLIDLSPEVLINTLDFSYFEEILSKEEAISPLKAQQIDKDDRLKIIETGYPGYDTSIGWFSYSDEKVLANIQKTMDNGFTAMKLTLGAQDPQRDIRHAQMVRKIAGDNATIMFDANQQWNLPAAIAICKKIKGF